MAEEKQQETQEHEHYTPEVDAVVTVPHLHMKTYLVVFALFMFNIAQVMQLASAGSFASTVASVVGGADKASWLINSVLLPMTVLAVPVSQAADYWGRRWLLIGLNSMGFVGCLITSRSTSISMAIAGQSVVGLAFVSVPLIFAVMSEVLPHQHRMTGQAIASLGNCLGGVIGLLAGSSALETHGPEGFRILWYIMAALFGAASLICVLCYNPPKRELEITLTHMQKFKSLDWIGILLLTGFLLPVLIGFSWADNPYPWKSTQVIAPIVVGIALLAAFGVYEWKFKTDGILNHRLFQRDRNMALALVGIFIEGLVFMAGNNYLSFEASILYLHKPILTGANFSLAFIVYGISTAVAALYCYRYKGLRIVLVGGFGFLLIFASAMYSLSLTSSSAIWGFPVLFGIGWGTSLPALVVVAQFGAPPDLIATTSGLMAASRGLGATIATAIYIAAFTSKLSILLPKKIAEAVTPLGLPASSLPLLIQDLVAGETEALAKVDGVTPTIIAAAITGMKTGYLATFRYIWIISIAFAALAVLMSFFFKDYKEDFNLKIDAPTESEEALFGDTKKDKVASTA